MLRHNHAPLCIFALTVCLPQRCVRTVRPRPRRDQTTPPLAVHFLLNDICFCDRHLITPCSRVTALDFPCPHKGQTCILCSIQQGAILQIKKLLKDNALFRIGARPQHPKLHLKFWRPVLVFQSFIKAILNFFGTNYGKYLIWNEKHVQHLKLSTEGNKFHHFYICLF